MNRPLAILFPALLVGLPLVEAIMDRNSIPDSTDLQTLVLNVIAQALLTCGLVTYCGFAALHSTQYISSPKERSFWLIVTLGMNVFGSCYYYLTTYRSFRKSGQGGLMRFDKPNDP